jgi:hypothetical protein
MSEFKKGQSEDDVKAEKTHEEKKGA